MTDKHTIFWFRRDLRLYDNKGFYHALKDSGKVLPIFIFDTDIIDSLPENDARVEFIHHSLANINKQIEKNKSQIYVYHGKPIEVFQKLIKDINIEAVYTNKDHEPYGIKRDQEIADFLKSKDISFHSYLDHLLFEKDEVLKKDGNPYTVFTPYKNKCYGILNQKKHLHTCNSEKHLHSISIPKKKEFPELKDIGFQPSGINFPDKENSTHIIPEYDKTRDYPALKGTTHLGVHLRFGTISLRKLAKYALQHNQTFFNELLWREFYAMILWHFPHVPNNSFKSKYDKIEWQNNKENFTKWKMGKTGYPIVDAGMRELKETGYMHNRVRMITASFLTKHLLTDWRWGEAWFAEKLLDYELSSNNGGWQWSAGSGCDAAPYFRIFNPHEQLKKFDKNFEYVKEWVKEWDTDQYPAPVIDHKFARERCLKVYKEALNS